MPRKGGKCGRSRGPTVPTTPWPALERSAVVNLEGLKKVRLVVVAESDEWGALRYGRARGLGGRGAPAVPLHFHVLLSGVLPPFSGFLNAVLTYYPIHVLHLHPHCLVLLSAFTFLCEAFVGVTPVVALLHHFYSLELISEMQCSGCAFLRIVDASAPGIPCVELLPEVEGFRRQWVQVVAAGAGALFQPPPSLAMLNRGWEREGLSDPRLASVLTRLGKLRHAGVSMAMVLRWLTGGNPDELPPNGLLLYCFKAPEALAAEMPLFNEWGLFLEGPPFGGQGGGLASSAMEVIRRPAASSLALRGSRSHEPQAREPPAVFFVGGLQYFGGMPFPSPVAPPGAMPRLPRGPL
ncbi:hypothetical protein D1007_52029 [Hordeum vulgare]|nr:hypothetical protein D1007_52029 [Hordeum vulgare]